MLSNLEKSEVPNIPDTYQASGDIWVGNLDHEEKRRKCSFNEPTGEWRIRKNKELQDLYQRPSIKEDITKRKLKWARYSWRKTGSLIKIVQENAPKGKRPLGRPRLRWEDRIKEYIEKVRLGLDWKQLALDRKTWRQICWMT
ncbi:putative transposon-derived protein F52C9.6 [Aphis craccivora]|uniref:Putative transposon-derived protein F52C9.6 n=1 Tax=Aphis craccivora TaxID=307492 RepID=A0A6G0ZK84_APHCR|nr:putative transposon-derived protein F52C9.6 [Aphis craccivora]